MSFVSKGYCLFHVPVNSEFKCVPVDFSQTKNEEVGVQIKKITNNEFDIEYFSEDQYTPLFKLDVTSFHKSGLMCLKVYCTDVKDIKELFQDIWDLYSPSIRSLFVAQYENLLKIPEQLNLLYNKDSGIELFRQGVSFDETNFENSKIFKHYVFDLKNRINEAIISEESSLGRTKFRKRDYFNPVKAFYNTRTIVESSIKTNVLSQFDRISNIRPIDDEINQYVNAIIDINKRRTLLADGYNNTYSAMVGILGLLIGFFGVIVSGYAFYKGNKSTDEILAIEKDILENDSMAIEQEAEILENLKTLAINYDDFEKQETSRLDSFKSMFQCHDSISLAYYTRILSSNTTLPKKVVEKLSEAMFLIQNKDTMQTTSEIVSTDVHTRSDISSGNTRK
ncbi:hypothetical protein E9993_13685 [Labilibacter sediminis]|nr:hypothetical protein E9993_13685 [Labilibacter sediminis]